jgi:uncharacterized membrane protein
MKNRLLTAVLCASLVLIPVNETRSGGVLVLFVLACAATAGIFTIYVYSHGEGDSVPHKLVLQKDHYDCNWVNVATNYAAPITTTNSISLFWDYMTDDLARYRVQDMGRLDKP